MNISPHLGALLLGLAQSGAPQATATDLVVERLPSPAGPSSELSNLARGADGRLYVSWVEREGRVGALKLAHLGERGWSAPVEVVRADDLFLNWADFPSVAALEDGVLLAQWLRSGATPHAYDAEFAISADGGATWSAPRRLHDDRSAAEHGFVSLVPLDGARFGALWLDGRAMAGAGHDGHGVATAGEHGAGATGVYYREVSAKGELGPERLLDPRACDCCQTTLVRTAGGELLAAYRDRSADEVRDISAVRVTAEAASEPASVFDDGWEIAGCPVNGPRLATSGETTAVAWFTGAGEGGGRVSVAFRGESGAGFGFPIGVDDGSPVGRVDVVALDEDSALVTWLEYVDVETGAEWRARRVWKDGRRGAAVVLGAVPSERASGFLRLAPTRGGALATWTTAERTVALARVRAR